MLKGLPGGWKKAAAAALAAGLLASACTSSREDGRDGGRTLVITGSSTLAPLVREIGRKFESLQPGLRVDVQTGGSSRGIHDLLRGLADLAMVSRSLTDSEQQKGLQGFPLALDGVALIVHEENPLTSLSRLQVAAIYTGQIRDWGELGGPGAPITVVNKAEGRATLEVFTRYFGLKNSQIRAHVIIGDNEQAVKVVAGNRNAIAYVSIGTAEHNQELGVPVRLLALDGVPASSEQLQKGRYPLRRILHLVSREQPQGLAKRFLEFALSSQVHHLIREQDFVPIP